MRRVGIDQVLSIFPGAALSFASIDENAGERRMHLRQLLTAPPKLHGPAGAPTDGWRLDDAALHFLEAHVRSDMRTIETGAGVSTIVFALKRSRHTCVVPDRHVVRRIRRYCASADISLRTVTFLLDRSEYALPKIDTCAYDFALIDGRHGFPAPFIDWFYIADRLCPGGIVLVDDTWIWTCEVLVRFLDTNPGWHRCGDLPTSAAFVKDGSDSHHDEWVDQPFVYWQSPAARFYPSGTCVKATRVAKSRGRKPVTR
jgi:predicted O-methyltransferase YrrM